MSKIIVIGCIALVVIMTTVYTIIFCFKGSYPELMYTTLCGAIIGELILCWQLEIDKRKREWTDKKDSKDESSNIDQ